MEEYIDFFCFLFCLPLPETVDQNNIKKKKKKEQLFSVISNGVEGRQQFRTFSKPGKGAFIYLFISLLSEKRVSKCMGVGGLRLGLAPLAVP